MAGPATAARERVRARIKGGCFMAGVSLIGLAKLPGDRDFLKLEDG
jgi:hypothetical protein